MGMTRWVATVVVGSALALAGCGGSGGGSDGATTTNAPTTTKVTTTTKAPTTTTMAAVTTTVPPTAVNTTPPDAPATTVNTTPPTTPPTTAAPMAYGSPCTLGSHPDCIDPDEDGQGTYLKFGAKCMAETAPIAGKAMCSDLDGDGVAGYPDAG